MAARGDSMPLSWLKAQPSAENAGMLLLEEEPSAGNAAHPANALLLDENVKC